MRQIILGLASAQKDPPLSTRTQRIVHQHVEIAHHHIRLGELVFDASDHNPASLDREVDAGTECDSSASAS